jgi:hypothetical protein
MMANNKTGITIPAIAPPDKSEPDFPAVSDSGFLIVEVNGWRKSELQVVTQLQEAGDAFLASRKKTSDRGVLEEESPKAEIITPESVMMEEW